MQMKKLDLQRVTRTNLKYVTLSEKIRPAVSNMDKPKIRNIK